MKRPRAGQGCVGGKSDNDNEKAKASKKRRECANATCAGRPKIAERYDGAREGGQAS